MTRQKCLEAEERAAHVMAQALAQILNDQGR